MTDSMPLSKCCQRGWPALVLACLAFAVGAQTQDEIAALREDLAQRRAALDAAHERSRVECYQRFAVNDCLLAAKRLRGEQMGDLRRQDIALNDLERKRKSAEQVRKMEARQVDSTVQQAQTQRAERAEAVQQKQQTQEARVAKPPPVPKPPNRPAVVQPGRSAAERAEAASAFEQRQQAAQERQAEVQKARAKRSKPLAEPLPSRGATPTPLQSELTGQP